MPSYLGSDSPNRTASCPATQHYVPEDESLPLLIVYNYSLNIVKTHNFIVHL
jgi:hypothetical protein